MAEEKLKRLAITLPPPPKPVAAYVPAVRTGNLLFVSGTLPTKEGKVTIAGKVGRELSIDQGREAMRQACLNSLAIIRSELGSLDRVRRVVRVVGHVNSAPGFTEQPQVVNGASEFLVELFGEKGKHSRLALGAAELPMNAAVELDVIVEVE